MAQIGQIGQMGQLSFMSFGSFLATLFPQIDILMRRLSSLQADQETAVVIKYFSHSCSSSFAACCRRRCYYYCCCCCRYWCWSGTEPPCGQLFAPPSHRRLHLDQEEVIKLPREVLLLLLLPAAAPCGVDWLCEPPTGNVYRTLGQVLSPASTILAK